jgi:hypothetical protein
MKNCWIGVKTTITHSLNCYNVQVEWEQTVVSMIHCTPRPDLTSVVIDTDCIGSCKWNYHDGPRNIFNYWCILMYTTKCWPNNIFSLTLDHWNNSLFPFYLLFQWTSTIKIQLRVMVWYKADLIIISLKINLFSPLYRWKIAELVLNNNHSLNCYNVQVEWEQTVVCSFSLMMCA